MEDNQGTPTVKNEEVTDPQPEVPAVKEGESATPKAQEEIEEGKGAKPSEAQKRIRQLVAERHERDREIESLKRELAEKGKVETGKPAEVPAGQMPPKPQAANYTDYDEYLTDLAVWKGQVKTIQDDQARTQKLYQDNLQKMEDSFKKRISEDSVDNPEITAMLDRVGARISPAAAFAVKQSEASPILIRYLDANPAEIDRLSKLDLVAAAREIGKIESKMTSNGPAKIKSGAPEPHKPAGKGEGTITTPKSEDEMPIDDYMKAFRKKGRN